MPLTISLRKGQSFTVGDHKFQCVEVGPEKQSVGYYCDFTLRCEGKDYRVDEDLPLNLPGITIGAGIRRRPRGRLACITVVADGLRVSRDSTCEVCHGRGTIEVREPCPHCNAGCSRCTNGWVFVKSACPECNQGE